MSFRIDARDTRSAARAASLTLPHGTVSTPAFMPVGTNASVKAVWPRDLVDLGFRMVLANSYHLYLRPGADTVARHGGLHRFMAWQGNLLTDSGGFQVFSLAPLRNVDDDGVAFRSHLDGSRHRLTPESVVDVQTALGSDVIMPLDVCSAADVDHAGAEQAAELTARWAARAAARWRCRSTTTDQQLWGIVQGGLFPDLRARSASDIRALDLPGSAIGGLSIGESAARFEATVAHTAPMLDPERPRYLMGVGSPDLILCGVEHGVDLFDSVYPTRVARNALALTRAGTLSLRTGSASLRDDPLDAECACAVCAAHSRAYLRHLFKAREIMAAVLTTYHNLAFMAALMESAREAIAAGGFAAFKSGFLDRYLDRSSADERP